MAQNSIFAFDNGTGMDIPEKVDVYPVSILLGSSVADVKANVPSTAKIFCVFTKLQDDYGFVVKTEEHAERLRKILTFGKIRYTVGVQPSSMWYTDAGINLIVSSTCKLRADQIAMIISAMCGITAEDGTAVKKNTSEMYMIVNIRNSKIIYRTTKYTEAVKVCDRNPCCIVLKRGSDQIVYKSMYGKVTVPSSSETQMSKYRAKVIDQHKFNIGNIF